jgi:hypothetical protein
MPGYALNSTTTHNNSKGKGKHKNQRNSASVWFDADVLGCDEYMLAVLCRCHAVEYAVLCFAVLPLPCQNVGSTPGQTLSGLLQQPENPGYV